jgi:type IV secretory pathway VirB2 component (pilin)
VSTLALIHETASHLIDAAGTVPDPGNGDAPPGFDKFVTVLGWVKWVALGIAVAGVIIIGAKLTIDNRRGEGGQHLGSLGFAMIGIIIIAGAVSLVSFLVS